MSSKVKFIGRRRKAELLRKLSEAQEGSDEAKALREQLGHHAPPENPKLETSNSQKIEELKTKIPEPIVEEPVVLEEPKFMTEAEPVKVEKEETPKVEVKKTTKKRAPRKTTTRAKKTNTKTKSTSSKK